MSRLAGARVLVTGADGFIGSHLVERLLAEGARVRAFCLYNSRGSLGWLDELDPGQADRVDAQLGDIRDARAVRAAVDGVDVVFHLAALIAIPYSYQAPASFVDTNVTGTLNLLEAVRDSGATRMVHTSTSEVYGTPQTVPIGEGHPLRAQSPYSASKIAADQLCHAYACSFGTPVVTLRPFNTFGPRQSGRAVIPTILGQLLAGADEVRLGSLEPRRDFTFVEDTVDGFVRMAEADIAAGEVVQLGTGRSVSVAEVLAACCAVVGRQVEPCTSAERVRPAASEVKVLLSDPTRAADVLGWKPGVGLEDGLARTAAWLRPRVDPRTAGRYQR
ncbi:MAG: SDR family NAD(P)-dependent oxidoreductase [Mycobacteriales bacterium]